MWHRDIRVETGGLEEEDECVWEREFCELCDLKLQTSAPRNQLNCFLMSCHTSQHCNVLPCILSLFLPLPHVPPVSFFVFSDQPWRFPCSIYLTELNMCSVCSVSNNLDSLFASCYCQKKKALKEKSQDNMFSLSLVSSVLPGTFGGYSWSVYQNFFLIFRSWEWKNPY